MALSTSATDLPAQEPTEIKIKTEQKDDVLDNETKSIEIDKLIVSDPQLSGLQSRNITVTAAAPQKDKAVASSKSIEKDKASNEKEAKSEPPPIDHSSICGAFGWTTFGSVDLPIIMRGGEKFISVKMFESKIVFGYFPDIFPSAIFSCTNINSYYITENEAKLLNEINSFHCDYQFGYNDFTTKDYVVGLKDAENLFEFLEFSKYKLYNKCSETTCRDKCGFFLNKIPYIKKNSEKYISLNTVYAEGVAPPVSNTEAIAGWDIAYLRLLSCFGFVDLENFKIGTPLCNIKDLEKALGGVRFDEVSAWPDIRFSSKEEWNRFLNPRILQWIPESAAQSPAESISDPRHLIKTFDDIQEKESTLNSFLGLNKYLDSNAPISRTPHAKIQDSSNPLNILQGSEKTSLFPVSLENFFSSPSSNYPYPVNYNHYNSHIQTPSVLEYERYRKAEGSLPSFSSKKPRTFPPPPPLVRLGNSQSSLPTNPNVMPKSSLSSLYPYLPPPPNSSCPPWLARILEPDWLQEDEGRPNEAPENLSKRLSGETEAWCPTTASMNLNGSSSTGLVRNSSNPYELSHDRILHTHGGSPRLLAGPGPPPHYPTPPQSSPLQPLSLLDCATMPGFTDIYGTRLTPSGLVDLCSPPPSPEMRTALSGSPRGPHLSSYAYQPHVTRLVQVDSRYVLAINIEPLKYNSNLAVPISDVVNKFLRGTSVQSCQMMLETVFGLHLYECTSLQQEAFNKHNLAITLGSKLILLTDLKNCLYQLKFLLLEREKQTEQHCDITSKLPSAKRWCGNAREC